MKKELKNLKEAFLEHLTLKGMRPLTVRQNDLALRVFIGWLSEKGLNDVEQVDRDLFEDYKAWLSAYTSHKGERLGAGTVRERIFTPQRWFAWLKKKGVLTYDPIADVKAPRRKKQLPRGVMRPDEISKVMAQPDLKSVIGYRDRTIMEVLYSTGARAAELVGIKVPDVDLQKKMVRIRNGKGGRDRFVPLSTPCCRFLDRYIKEIRPELLDGMRPCGNNWLKKANTGKDLLFLSLYGGPVGKVWLGCFMKEYIRKAGIKKVVSPVHSFRHSVATHLLESGMDVRYVQAILGHNNINSTQIYTHVERATLQGMLKKYHPRELARENLQIFIDEEKKAKAYAAA
ncbi:MAG TPA: tyrosine-type recombinase/integrase [Elusimicrobiales bacterium]|nr:tyrosine-type recombinase/integrase [Elusimicrobiales bacterium]